MIFESNISKHEGRGPHKLISNYFITVNIIICLNPTDLSAVIRYIYFSWQNSFVEKMPVQFVPKFVTLSVPSTTGCFTVVWQAKKTHIYKYVQLHTFILQRRFGHYCDHHHGVLQKNTIYIYMCW
jgi:hypothetical protein